MSLGAQTWARPVYFLVGLAAALAAGQAARASLLAHTGTVGSTPPGTGAVNVTFLKGTTNPGQDYFGASEIFNENAAHTIINDFGVTTATASLDRAIEGVMNNTPDAWNAYAIQLVGADFAGLGSGLASPDVNPVVVGGAFGDALIHMNVLTGTFGVASSSITRTATDATLVISFDTPVQPGDIFQLGFDFFGSGTSVDPAATNYEAALNQLPFVAPVPEPGTCVLLSAGAMLLARRIRRHR